MARTKVEINIVELQDAINQLEGAKLFSSPHKLYEAIAQTNWARGLGATAVMIYLRVKEANTDPNNPQITMKVKPARRVGPREAGEQGESRPAAPTARRTKATGVTFAGLDMLIETFRDRGVEITGPGNLITSSQKTAQENRAIMLAWADLRDKLGLPKPIKKTADAVNDEVVQVAAAPTPDFEVIPVIEPGAEIEVTEEMPDGSPVPSQTVLDVEPVGEPEVTLDVAPIESAVPVAPLLPPTPAVPATPVRMPTPVAAPQPIQVTPTRPMARPAPVRSSVPPRPMPATPQNSGGKPGKLEPWGGIFAS